MKFFHGKKATEKPIEIFVALFVILAVAMVMLKMFQGQIEQKQQQLAQLEQESKLKEAVDQAKLYCGQKCASANENSCSEQFLAKFCIAKVEGGIDWNSNGDMTNYAPEFPGGLGSCEDTVYCAHLKECTCNRELSLSACIPIMCKYWKDQGSSQQQSTARLKQFIQAGDCYGDLDSTQSHWYKLIKNSLNCSEQY